MPENLGGGGIFLTRTVQLLRHTTDKTNAYQILGDGDATVFDSTDSITL